MMQSFIESFGRPSRSAPAFIGSPIDESPSIGLGRVGTVFTGRITDDNVPVIRVRFHGDGGRTIEGDMILDSGAQVSVIAEEICKELGMPVAMKVPAKGVCGGCDVTIVVARFELVSSSGTRGFQGKCIAKSDLKPYAGLLGQDVLKEGLMLFDGPSKRWELSFPG